MFCFSACEGCKKEYTLTFCQEQGETAQITLKKGEELDESLIPALIPKTGYEVKWDRTDFSSIDGDLTVNAVYTPKNYLISYAVGEDVEISSTTQTVVFDADYSLLTPTKDGFHFFGWTWNAQTVDNAGKWAISQNVTLEPMWIKGCAVTFVMEKGADVVFNIPEGSSIAVEDIPTPDLDAKTGYDVMWDTDAFENIRSNMTVTSLYRAKSYTITYRAGAGAVLPIKTQTVFFDNEYELFVPTMDNAEFLYWRDSETGKKVENGIWQTDGDITLVAVWYYWSPNV